MNLSILIALGIQDIYKTFCPRRRHVLELIITEQTVRTTIKYLVSYLYQQFDYTPSQI
jgi:hypothetical protein